LRLLISTQLYGIVSFLVGIVHRLAFEIAVVVIVKIGVVYPWGLAATEWDGRIKKHRTTIALPDRRRKISARMKMKTRAIPPRTPPTIAPMLLELEEDAAALGVGTVVKAGVAAMVGSEEPDEGDEISDKTEDVDEVLELLDNVDEVVDAVDEEPVEEAVARVEEELVKDGGRLGW